MWNAPRVVIPPPIRNARVSACEPLCAIFLRKPSVYPLSLVKANVGRLWEKLKNAMKSGLGRSCSGNFLAIFAGTLLDEKPNFLSRIFGRGRPFDFSTDKGPQSQAPATRPQSPAVRGFPRFGNRSLRCTLRGIFAVLGEREAQKRPVTADFSRWPFRRRLRKSQFSSTRKSAFGSAAIFGVKRAYFAPL